MKKPEFTYNDIYETIREYHWMIHEADRLRKQLESAREKSALESVNARRKQKAERVTNYEKRINFINLHRCILSERDRVILDCLIDGMKIKDLAAHLRIDRKTVERSRNRIIEMLIDSQTDV